MKTKPTNNKYCVICRIVRLLEVVGFVFVQCTNLEGAIFALNCHPTLLIFL